MTWSSMDLDSPYWETLGSKGNPNLICTRHNSTPTGLEPATTDYIYQGLPGSDLWWTGKRFLMTGQGFEKTA